MMMRGLEGRQGHDPQKNEKIKKNAGRGRAGLHRDARRF